MNLQNNAKDEWSKDLRQLIGEIVITMGTEKGEKLVTEIKNKIHHQLQKARHNWLREEIVKLEGMKEENGKPGAYREDWDDWRVTGRNKALQTIIDRYLFELDQDNK